MRFSLRSTKYQGDKDKLITNYPQLSIYDLEIETLKNGQQRTWIDLDDILSFYLLLEEDIIIEKCMGVYRIEIYDDFRE